MQIICYYECHLQALYVECRYAECRYPEGYIQALNAECRSAPVYKQIVLYIFVRSSQLSY